MNPVVAKKAMTVWQDAYPSRCCCPFHIVVNGKKMTVTCFIQAQSNAFCQHATSNRECLPDDAGQIRQCFFLILTKYFTLSKPIHQNVFHSTHPTFRSYNQFYRDECITVSGFFLRRIYNLIADLNYRDCRRRRCVSATTFILRYKENDSNTPKK